MLSANLSPHKPVGLNARVRALVHICVCGNWYARKSVVCTQMRHIARLLVSNTCMQLCMLTLSLSLFSLSLSPSHTHITRLIVSCMNLCMLTFIEAFKKCNDISHTHTHTQTHRHRHRQTQTQTDTQTHTNTQRTHLLSRPIRILVAASIINTAVQLSIIIQPPLRVETCLHVSVWVAPARCHYANTGR
jgi:hypothetical protein